MSVTRAGDETFIQIQETQAALRESIDKAKDLAAKSEILIRKHRDETEAKPPNPAQ